MQTSTRPYFINGGNLAFVVTAAAGYLSVLLDPPRATINYPLLFGVGMLFIVNGVFGGEYLHTYHPRLIPLYFVIQLILGIISLVVGKGSGALWLIPLPVLGQAASMFGMQGVLIACTVAVLGLGSVVWVLTGDLANTLMAGFTYIPGVAFVVIFTRMVVKEANARREVERLAAELEEANTKLRAAMVEMEEVATLRERNRLAREIHDSLGHYLTVVNVQIEAARTVLDADRPRALDALAKAQSLTREGLTEVRRSVSALRSPAIEGRTLAEAITKLAEETSAAGIPVQVEVNGQPRDLTPQVEMAIYRAAQEGLTNIRKHAKATHAALTLDYQAANRLRLLILDDGIGIEATQHSGGYGLLGVQERVRLLGGDVHLTPNNGHGLRFEVEIPT